MGKDTNGNTKDTNETRWARMRTRKKRKDHMNSTYTMRPATPEDIPAILELLRAHDIAEQGKAEDHSPEEATRWMRNARKTWAVTDPAGRLVGYLELQAEGHGVLYSDGYVHPEHRGQGIGSHLVQTMLDAAPEYIAEQPEGAQVILQSGTNQRNADAQAIFAQHGFRLERVFYRMLIEMTEPPPAPQWSAGITVRHVIRGEERAVFDAVQASFQDHWGTVQRDYEQWYERRINTPKYDPEQWYLAMDGEQIAGFSLCSLDANGGRVDTLGVLRGYRKHGLGLALLHYSFGAFWQRGITSISLGVDGASLTGAVRLYERGGMHIDQQWAVWAKILREGEDLRTTELPE